MIIVYMLQRLWDRTSLGWNEVEAIRKQQAKYWS